MSFFLRLAFYRIDVVEDVEVDAFGERLAVFAGAVPDVGDVVVAFRFEDQLSPAVVDLQRVFRRRFHTGNQEEVVVAVLLAGRDNRAQAEATVFRIVDRVDADTGATVGVGDDELDHFAGTKALGALAVRRHGRGCPTRCR